MTIIYRTATSEDTKKIREFIRLNFLPDEPILSSWQRSKEKEERSDEEKELEFSKILQSGFSTIAEDTINENTIVVGVRVSKSIKKSDPISKPPNEVFELFDFIASKADVFNTFQVDRIVKGILLCVHRDFRGRGIATRLYTENMKLAGRLDYPLYVCDCSNKFTILACEKLQMTKVYELLYEDYVDSSGQPIFKVAHPHDKVTVFAQRL